MPKNKQVARNNRHNFGKLLKCGAIDTTISLLYDILPVQFALSSFAESFVYQTYPSSEGIAVDTGSCNMYMQQLQK